MRLVTVLILLLLFAPVTATLAAAPDALPASAADEQLDNFGLAPPPPPVYDPLQPVNRKVFWLNDKLYFYLFKPVARAWRIVPQGARTSVGNFFSNITTPVRFANDIPQWRLENAGTELGRFVLNSTVGIGGLFDPARKEGLKKREADFGQTLGRYGAGPGPYLDLPVLGPSNIRDGIGKVVDLFLDPATYLLTTPEQVGATGADMENALSLDKDTYEAIKRDSLDPYLFIRNAYDQRRRGQIGR